VCKLLLLHWACFCISKGRRILFDTLTFCGCSRSGELFLPYSAKCKTRSQCCIDSWSKHDTRYHQNFNVCESWCLLGCDAVWILRNVGILPQNYKASHPRRPRLDTSSWKPQISHQVDVVLSGLLVTTARSIRRSLDMGPGHGSAECGNANSPQGMVHQL
jgi:hypothetical protein